MDKYTYILQRKWTCLRLSQHTIANFCGQLYNKQNCIHSYNDASIMEFRRKTFIILPWQEKMVFIKTRTAYMMGDKIYQINWFETIQRHNVPLEQCKCCINVRNISTTSYNCLPLLNINIQSKYWYIVRVSVSYDQGKLISVSTLVLLDKD